MLNNHKFTEFIVTSCYVGKVKYCPGTWGSLIAFPLAYIIVHFTKTNKAIFLSDGLNIAQAQLLTLFLANFLVVKILFAIGVYYSSLYIKQHNIEDPKEIVIDEVVGQLLTINLCFISSGLIHNSDIAQILSANVINIIFLLIMPFILFRIFDITKPWPINWLDSNIKGGLGVMLDDVLAAIFASIIHYVLVFVIIDLVG